MQFIKDVTRADIGLKECKPSQNRSELKTVSVAPNRDQMPLLTVG
jgi:hypothetical protein